MVLALLSTSIAEIESLSDSEKCYQPLDFFPFTGEPVQIKSLGKTKAWIVDNSKFYLHPEYLAAPSQYKKHRSFEFGMVNPKYIGRKYSTLIWKLGQQEKKVQAIRLYSPSNLPISGLKFIEKQIF